MNHNEQCTTRTPAWVWAACIALALLQPAAHLVTMYAPPQGMTPAGLHIPDSALFLQAMQMFSSGYESHYASSISEWGNHDWRYFAIPHLWLYIGLGYIGDATGLPDYGLYTLANALGVLAYLLALWWFLRNLLPGVAPRA